MDRALLISNIEAAEREVKGAEAEIETLLADLRVMPRAEKTTISAALESAFKKLRAARLNLEALEHHLRANDRDDH